MTPRMPSVATARTVWRTITAHGTARTVVLLVLLWPITLTLIPVAIVLAGVAVLAQILTWPGLALLAAAGVMLAHHT